MGKLFSNLARQRVPLIISFFFVISLSLPISSQNIEKKICRTEECLAAAKNLGESMNFTVDPCDNFYEYVCGKSSSADPIQIANTRNFENLQTIVGYLKQNNSNDEPEAVHKARKFFSLCMNKAAYSNSLEQIEILLQKIGLPVFPFMSNETENYDYTTILARAIRLANIGMYFDLRVNSNPYNQTLNMITLTKGTTDINRLLDIEMYIITKIICEDQHLNFCNQLRTPTDSDFVRNPLFTEILNQRAEIVKIIKKPRSTLNSSAIDVYTLKQLQDLTNNIAAEVNATISTLNWTRYIEEMFTDLDNVTLDLSDPNQVQITILELDAVKDMIQYIHESRNTKVIGSSVSITNIDLMKNAMNALLDKLFNEGFPDVQKETSAVKQAINSWKEKATTAIQECINNAETIIKQELEKGNNIRATVGSRIIEATKEVMGSINDDENIKPEQKKSSCPIYEQFTDIISTYGEKEELTEFKRIYG